MDKQKQIEEMAKVLESKHLSMCTWDSYNDDFNDNYPNECKKVATALYNAGCRKITEGAVVLTKEEYENLQALKDDYVKGYEAGVDEGWNDARKETAQTFAELAELKSVYFNMGNGNIYKVVHIEDINEIAKEIMDGK